MKFTNVSSNVIEGARTDSFEFDNLAVGYTHFQMFVGRQPSSMFVRKIISISRTAVVVEDVSPVITSRMTYEGSEEEMIVPVSIAAGILALEMGPKASEAVDALVRAQKAATA